MLRRYTFKLYPNAAQLHALREHSRMMAQLWNALLQRNEDCYRRTRGQRGSSHGDGRSHLSYQDMCREITSLRAECPEWSALSTSAARGIAQRLHLAFRAFFKRAKGGAGAQSGYPRYKRARDGMSICFTEVAGGGWNFSRRPDCATEGKASGGWLLRCKGIPGHIKARGRPAASVKEWRTGEIVFRDGSWWLSIVAECERKRAHGTEQINIRLDLIDEFARVERANGGAPAASQEEITRHLRGVNADPGRDAPQMQGDETPTRRFAMSVAGRDAPQMQGDETDLCSRVSRVSGRDAPQMQGDETCCRRCPIGHSGRDAPQMQGDETPWVLHDLRRTGRDAPQMQGDETAAGHRTTPPTGRDAPQMQGDETQELGIAAILCERADAIKTARDIRRRRFSCRWRREARRAARLTAKAARIRKHALHRWSYEIIRDAADLTLIAPPIRKETASPRGNKKDWGANVEAVSNLNRNTLNQAPAMAVQMLRYKAEEAGIRCDIITDEVPKIGVGRDLVTVGKTIRRAKRTIRKAAA